ncbi:DUF2891 domain-containing protein [Salinimicrobium sp. GXAS 041]|uniref:DUF2891 domain-containing protein n=1 Tax=Salinimicrobium sp. GXAS 041 TaxID=3400806 RepID=UPI003C751BC8
MKKTIVVLAVLMMFSCKNENEQEVISTSTEDSTLVEQATALLNEEPMELTLEQANKLAELPLDCINTEYPNKLNQTLGSAEDLGGPKELHPAFYGCFDWHSAVHGHWSLVSLLKQFPELQKSEEIKDRLENSLSEENIKAEVAYFQKEHSTSFERTYGWAWLLKLAGALHAWNDPLARELEQNLQPLTNLMVENFKDFLPKLNYPIRVGEHTNTAFALALTYDYAEETNNEELLDLIKERAKDFYINDDNCPLDWEPSGFDFLSPCFSEIDIMRRTMPRSAFNLWMNDFMPQLQNEEFTLEPGEVSDRTDGKLVHLDGLNFSRAWVLYGLADQYPQKYGHLREVAREHVEYSLPNLVGDSYEGGHWLGSFAIYSLQAANMDRDK